MSDQTPIHYTPQAVAKEIEVSVQSVRRWADTYKELLSDDLRVGLRDVLDSVLTGTEIIIERYRKPSAVLISYSQWQTLKALQEKEDIAHARQVLADIESGKSGRISHADLLKLLLEDQAKASA